MDVINECRTTAELLVKAADLAADHKADAALARRNVEMNRLNMLAFMRERDALMEPFRNVYAKDWEHLFAMLPDSGHGQFWKAVMKDLSAVLATIPFSSKT